MRDINWARFTLGGVLAAILYFLSDGLLHGQLVDADWQALFEHLGRAADDKDHDHGGSMIYFAVFELGRGLVGQFLYMMMRARMGAGPRTAAAAGIVAWLALCIFPMVQLIPLDLFSLPLLAKAGGFQLLANVGGTLAGAAVYRED